MKVHISLNVNDINKSVNFYKKMLGAEPVKLFNTELNGNSDVEHNSKSKQGYAKFDLTTPSLNLVLNEAGFKAGGSLSHLGLQVETTDEVLEFRKKWSDANLSTVDEMEVNCCYAKQDKTWVRDPDGNEWEAFVVLADLGSMEEIDACDCNDKVSEHADDVVQSSCCDSNMTKINSAMPKHETCCQLN